MAAIDGAFGAPDRQAPGRQATRSRGGVAASGHVPTLWIVLFVASLVQAGYIAAGGMVIGAPRLLMLLAAVPVFVALAQGKAGKMIWPDIFMVLFVLWLLISIVANHGGQTPVNLTVATMVETLVPYFLARVLIRNEASFRFLFRCLFWSVALIMPFAAIESLTGQNILQQIYYSLPMINGFPGTGNPPRLGLERADGVFEHPILYGIYCALPLTMVVRDAFPGLSAFRRGAGVAVIVLAVLWSVSSGAMIAVMLQAVLMTWDSVLRTLRARWQLFLAGGVFGYIVMIFAVESSPLLYVVMHMSFNGSSAWNRVLIWEYGSQNVANNPIFGLGFRDWARPAWMLSSFDNYWLLIAMRHGIVGFALHAATILGLFYLVVRRNFSARPEIAHLRVSYLITIGALYVVMITVHLWSATYVLFIFLAGAGAWLVTEPAESDGKKDVQAVVPKQKFYSRQQMRAAMAAAEAERAMPEPMPESMVKPMSEPKPKRMPEHKARSRRHGPRTRGR